MVNQNATAGINGLGRSAVVAMATNLLVLTS